MSLEFIKLSECFRDKEQKHKVQNIIQNCLADDRKQEECRYLMRFWWQLSMSYQEVSLEELESFVSTEKLSVVKELLNAMEESHIAIDSWIEKYRNLPIIEDTGFNLWEK